MKLKHFNLILGDSGERCMSITLNQGWAVFSRVHATSNFFKASRSTKYRRCSEAVNPRCLCGPSFDYNRLKKMPTPALNDAREPMFLEQCKSLYGNTSAVNLMFCRSSFTHDTPTQRSGMKIQNHAISSFHSSISPIAFFNSYY
ncbi:hypothetical protein TNCV_3094531 [Trichonephila clavipes]|nr:hypothetical protein TNCV_3094531 [Trichonephila clavipes]